MRVIVTPKCMNRQPIDVLFAISDTGGGHRSAAVAISAALEQLSGGEITWAIEDLLQATNVPGIRSAPGIYDQLSTRWLKLYNVSFQLTNSRSTVGFLSRIVYLIARQNLERLLAERHPRLVVVTHPLVHRLVCAARRRHNAFRVVTVVTDLVTLHAAWSYPGVDLALTPTDEAYHLMRKRGMKPSQLQRCGFPVHPKFAAENRDAPTARRDLGFDPDRFTVLLTAGGVGAGRLGELVHSLEQQLPDKQLLVVTGKNRALYEDLRRGPRLPHTHVFGFVHNMEELMAASDVVVTKAGPGTLMEALVMRKPVIVTEAVGIQEHGNIDFVLNYELGFFCPTTERIVAAITSLEDPARYAATVERLKHAVPRDGAMQIARVIHQQLSLRPVR